MRTLPNRRTGRRHSRSREPQLRLLVNVDVGDLEKAIDFYRRALGLRLGRRLFGGEVAEMIGASSPIYLLRKRGGTRATEGARQKRSYRRHWTPIHLDFAVADIGAAVRGAVAAGAKLEGKVDQFEWGCLARFADPFGHGLCLVEFRGCG